MFENIGGGELLVILLLVLVFFGPKKIPEIGQNLGKGIRYFKNSMKEVQDTVNESLEVKDDPKPPETPQSK